MIISWKKLALAACLAGGLWTGARVSWASDVTVNVQVATTEKTDAAIRPKIQIALLLDTSNSMDGLISQAKTQLWKIVNEFATAKQNGRSPTIEVALYEYGKPTLGVENGFVRQILPFTTDLDKVSEELFALRTNGGDEFCGMVIRTALKQLNWSTRAGDLHSIYVCGNEPFTQGPVDFHGPCRDALAKGVTVNTIFCGPENEGIAGKWREGAQEGGGVFFNINQDRAVAEPVAPQDRELQQLNVQINNTYIGYGALGAEGKERQMAQDKAAEQAAPAAASARCVTKANANYDNGRWDVVDAVKDGRVKLEDMKKEDLPKEMQGMTLEQCKTYVAGQEAERKKIQDKIKALSAERAKFIAEEMKKSAAPAEKSLDEALTKSLREQATKNGYEFK